MVADPSTARVEADLQDPDFLNGLEAGRWRIISFAFPILDFAVSATEPDGSPAEYGFRAELTNYPGQAPMVKIWDHQANTLLAANRRPKGGARLERTFQNWSSETVYRPWDRMTGPHISNRGDASHLAWRYDRRLYFIFEDLHGILNSNARARRVRAAA
jgi:hypothetical protein